MAKKISSEAATAKSGASKREDGNGVVKSLEELILDYLPSKYTAIPLASLWAKELRRREENRHLTATEILELALGDVLGGKVDWKDAKKWAKNGKENSPEADGEKKSK